MTTCPSCHTTPPRPHTDYCRGNPLDVAVEAMAVAMHPDCEGPRCPAHQVWLHLARAGLAAGLPVLLDAVKAQAREHVAAGRGHMTWAEVLTQLRRMTEIASEETT